MEDLFAPVIDAFGSFMSLSKKLAALVLEPFGPYPKLSLDEEGEFEKLKIKLKGIRATLKTVESLVISDCSARHWLRELRDLELKAQDVVDEVEFRLERASEVEKFRYELLCMGSGKRKRDVSFCQFSRNSSSLSCMMTKLQERYVDIVSDRVSLAVNDADGERMPQASAINQTSSFPVEILHGRDKDLEKVIGLLLSDDHNQGKTYTVIPIFGMAGVGKTSLVQHVCEDRRVQSKFGTPIWVHASQQFDLMHLARRMEQGFLNESFNSLGMDLILRRINVHIKTKRFLLVFDDMWIENKLHWDILMGPLKNGISGSKVIVTTRNLNVAKMTRHKIYRLNCLSNDDCWSICRQIIKDGKLNFDLISIGKSITAKCKGLPLAAKAVGGVLYDNINEEHWEYVLENDLWLAKDACIPVLPLLQVSYDCLSMPLKQCFAYCSLFPKGHIFQRDQMAKLWTSQGFINSSKPSPCHEYTARKYFDQLVAKCFFQLGSSNDLTEESYKMHDLYHELAQHVSREECNRIEGCTFSCRDTDVRHSSLVPSKAHCNNTIEFGSFRGQDLRTFIFLGNMEYKSDGVPFCLKIPSALFLNMMCLHVLDLSNTDIKELSDSIGNLIHLRYLGLENTKIVSLPETISYLFNLLVINLSHCHDLVELPRGTKLLCNLRHLYLPVNRNSNIQMPCGMGQLTGLQSLRLFVVGRDNSCCQLEELGNLNNLSGELSITDIHHITDSKSAQGAKLGNKEKLQKLTLQWSGPNLLKTDLVLEKLQPHQNLKELVIIGFSGTSYASWLSHGYLSKLVILDLKDCVNTVELPSLGRLPSLKHLGIYTMPRVGRVDSEFCGLVGESSSNGSASRKGFPVLETLKFRKMDAWEVWGGVSVGDFPCLQYLVLDGCPKLRELPQIKPFLRLRVHGCEQLQNFPSPELLRKDHRRENLENLKSLGSRHVCCYAPGEALLETTESFNG